jgi:hypothetical protein
MLLLFWNVLSFKIADTINKLDVKPVGKSNERRCRAPEWSADYFFLNLKMLCGLG